MLVVGSILATFALHRNSYHTMTYNIIVERTATGYSAALETGGVYSGGKTFEELKKNLVEAMNDGLDRTDITFEDLNLKYDMRSFFETSGFFNVSGLAVELGVSRNLLSQYIAGTKKPSHEQARKIFQGVHALGKRLATMEFSY